MVNLKIELSDFDDKFIREIEEKISLKKDQIVKYNYIASRIFAFTFLLQLLVFLIIQFAEVYIERRKQ